MDTGEREQPVQEQKSKGTYGVLDPSNTELTRRQFGCRYSPWLSACIWLGVKNPPGQASNS